MKIGQQCIDYFKSISGLDKQARLPLQWSQSAADNSRFETTHHGGTDGNDALALGMSPGDRCTDRFRDVDELAVHYMTVNIFTAYRLKGAGADM